MTCGPCYFSSQVLSGTTWGNLLLWDGNTIKVEICRKEGRSCHVGMAQPFALEDELVMTMGSDGIIRVTFSPLRKPLNETAKF